jgi:hypothetical protein
MPTQTYSRKLDPEGIYADPSKGDPSFLSGVATALPGRMWTCNADDSDVTLNIDGAALTQQEIDDLDAAYAAWSTTSQTAYMPNYPVTTSEKGLVLQVDWYGTDNGDGTYSDLARSEVNQWSGSKNSVLISTTTTCYARDGSVRGTPLVESYYTTSDDKRVKKASNV